MRGERWKEGDWPIEIMTEKRRVKPTTRLKEALGELTGANQAAAASAVVVVVELKEPEEGEPERHVRPRRKKAKVEQDADEGTGERTKNTEEERAERNVMAAAAAVMVAPAPRPRRGAAAKAVEEEKEKTDPELPRLDALPPEPPAAVMGPVLSGTAMWEQAERAREVQEALEHEVYVVENGPAPRVERVEYAVRASEGERQMSFICQMTDGRGLVQLSKPQVLEHPEGMDVLLDFYERHVIISSKLKDASRKNNN
jgi:hypothetical protein